MKVITYQNKYQKATAEFIQQVKNEMGWTRPWSEDVTVEYLENGGNFWLAIEDGKIIGTIALKNMGNGRGYLKRMFVHQDHRGTGVADTLLEKLLEHARDLKLNIIYLSTASSAERAIGFYQKHNFQKIAALPEDFKGGGNVFFQLKLDKL